MAPVAVVDTPRKQLLDTGSTESFGKLCRRICSFLAGEPSVLVVGGPTGCGKLTAAQHCVALAGCGLVEIVNQSAAATDIVSKIRRSGSMLTTTGSCAPSVITISGADGLQSGAAELLRYSRQCKKHVIILMNNTTIFGTLPVAQLYRCSWQHAWSWKALLSTVDAVANSNMLTTQQKGSLVRNCSDMRQLKIATGLLVSAKQHGCDESEVMCALCDSPVHQWHNTLAIMKGASLPTEQHSLGWIAGSYLGGLPSGSLEGAASFAGNLVVADMLQQFDAGDGQTDPFSALVLQSSMPLIVHTKKRDIQKVRLDLPRSNKRARYSATLEF